MDFTKESLTDVSDVGNNRDVIPGARGLNDPLFNIFPTAS